MWISPDTSFNFQWLNDLLKYMFHSVKKENNNTGLKSPAVAVLIMSIENIRGQKLCLCITKQWHAPFTRYTLSWRRAFNLLTCIDTESGCDRSTSEQRGLALPSRVRSQKSGTYLQIYPMISVGYHLSNDPKFWRKNILKAHDKMKAFPSKHTVSAKLHCKYRCLIFFHLFQYMASHWSLLGKEEQI